MTISDKVQLTMLAPNGGASTTRNISGQDIIMLRPPNADEATSYIGAATVVHLQEQPFRHSVGLDKIIVSETAASISAAGEMHIPVTISSNNEIRYFHGGAISDLLEAGSGSSFKLKIGNKDYVYTVNESVATIRTLIQAAKNSGSLPVDVARRLPVTYNFATNGGAVGSILLTPNLPDNAIVVKTIYEVSAAFTSATSTATVSVGIRTDDTSGLVASSVITSGYTLGNHDGIQDGAAATFSNKVASGGQIEMIVGVEPLTAGVATFWFDYVIGAS